ncbi:MAG: hypothetical protein AAB596_01435 [Patescibacteria group bacterium]
MKKILITLVLALVVVMPFASSAESQTAPIIDLNGANTGDYTIASCAIQKISKSEITITAFEPTNGVIQRIRLIKSGNGILKLSFWNTDKNKVPAFEKYCLSYISRLPKEIQDFIQPFFSEEIEKIQKQQEPKKMPTFTN